jgi:hypothetical protein
MNYGFRDMFLKIMFARRDRENNCLTLKKLPCTLLHDFKINDNVNPCILRRFV